ncbi:hypothetical protein SMY41_002332 [Cronobacter sakazakii]|nr:hypothetical protein [Cronobacter sakazakii]KAB0871703.1 hypothetical protein FZI03_12035 [Cronobacter sakazakii]
MAQEKAKYRILRLSFIGNQLLDEGAEIEYDGEPGSALEPINDAAKAAKKKAEQKRGNVSADAKPAAVTVVNDGEGDGDGDGAFSGDMMALRQQYEELFDKKPGNKTADTLKKEIAEKRAELGV